MLKEPVKYTKSLLKLSTRDGDAEAEVYLIESSEIPHEAKLAVHKSLGSKTLWQVTEVTTGAEIPSQRGGSRKEAIGRCITLLNNMSKEDYDKAIVKFIKIYAERKEEIANEKKKEAEGEAQDRTTTQDQESDLSRLRSDEHEQALEQQPEPQEQQPQPQAKEQPQPQKQSQGEEKPDNKEPTPDPVIKGDSGQFEFSH